MFIIGHRGVASLAPENTIYSIRRALEIGVDAVEIDVRMTADSRLALIHDSNLWRTCGDPRKVSELSLKGIQLLPTISGEPVPSLEEALQASKQTTLIIEGKDTGWASPLTKVLQNYPDAKVKVISFNDQELAKFHKLIPKVPVWFLARTKPLEALHLARKLDFDGVNLYFWLLNPLTYWLARLRHKEIAVYTVNSVWLARYLKRLFPGIWLTTDFPQRMQQLRD